MYCCKLLRRNAPTVCCSHSKNRGVFPRNPLVFNYLGKPPKTVVGMVCFELFGGEFPEVGRSLFGSEQSSQAYSGIQERGEVVI